MTSLEYEALLECAVIRYARPFSDNAKKPKKADSRLNVDPKKVLTDQELVPPDLHERIVDLVTRSLRTLKRN